jgi:hypothetical protein
MTKIVTGNHFLDHTKDHTDLTVLAYQLQLWLSPKQSPRKPDGCHGCGQLGHFILDCPHKSNQNSNATSPKAVSFQLPTSAANQLNLNGAT